MKFQFFQVPFDKTQAYLIIDAEKTSISTYPIKGISTRVIVKLWK